MLGISIGTVTQAGAVTSTQKIWRSLQALGAMAFAYSFSIILIEIQVPRIKPITIIRILHTINNIT